MLLYLRSGLPPHRAARGTRLRSLGTECLGLAVTGMAVWLGRERMLFRRAAPRFTGEYFFFPKQEKNCPHPVDKQGQKERKLEKMTIFLLRDRKLPQYYKTKCIILRHFTYLFAGKTVNKLLLF